VVLVAFPFAEGSFPAMAALYAVWGIVAFAAAVPVQHRLVAVDPASSALALSWYSTAMYLGIAIAPIAGAAAARSGGAVAVPLAGAVALALATVLFLAGWIGSRRARESEVAAERVEAEAAAG
jgi:MFS transporter, DHA1 family, inner membrane transport protein